MELPTHWGTSEVQELKEVKLQEEELVKNPLMKDGCQIYTRNKSSCKFIDGLPLHVYMAIRIDLVRKSETLK